MAMRFSLQLFVVHPVLTSETIGDKLGLTANYQHRIGTPRRTPAGDLLPGDHADTRWRYVENHSSIEGHFADQLSIFTTMIEQRREGIDQLLGSGGSVTVILAFLGDGAYGDCIAPDLLRRLTACGVDLGIEVYNTPQN